MRALRLTASLLSMLVAACAEDARPRGGDTVQVRADSVAGARLTDPRVATLVSQVNAAEVGAAAIALGRAGHPRVRAFADAMKREHATMDSMLMALPVAHAPMPSPPPQVPTLQAASKATGALLSALPAGPAFDRAYVASQVADHQMAADSLERWRQVVRDAALARTVDQALGRVRAHLEQARALQAALGGTGSPGEMTPPPASSLGPTEVERPGGRIGTQKPDTTVTPTPARPAPAPRAP